MRKLVTMLLCVVMAITQVAAQSRTIKGKVTDDKSNPVANASIQVKGTKIGTTSGTDGSFTISVPATAKVLTVTSLNFVTSDVTIGNSTTLGISLQSSSSNLDEVVVVGYGTAKKRTEIAGSIAQVSGDKLENKPTANVLDALQGKVPGLQIFSNSGEPSATPSIRLNGVGSLGASSTPLFVLDGIPVDQGTLLSLNPDDFETVDVLRDASAASIYGSRAANGVILITTKRGKLNSSKITFQTQYSVSDLTKNTRDLLNSVMNTKQLTDFQLATGQFTAAQVAARVAAGYTADTKWSDYYYKQNIPAFQADMNISGGGGKTTYYISGSFLTQDGLTYRSGYKRYTLRSNLTTTVNNWFQMGMNLSGGFDERQSNPYGSNSLNRGLSPLLQPYYSPFDASGNRYDFVPGLGLYSPEYLQIKNPSPSNNLQINPSAYIMLQPVKGLTLKSQAGLDFYDFRGTTLRLPSNLASLNNGSSSESFTRGTTKTITNTGEYKFKFGGHSFTALAGQEFISNETTGFTGTSTGQTDDRLVLLNAAATTVTASSSKTEYAFSSFFGRLNYNFDSKYLVDLSVREDNSSRFGRDLQGATFYSVGGSWHAKKENFLSNIKWLTDLSVKASIGTSGNSSIGDYTSLATVGSNTGSAYNAATGWFLATPGNPLLSWEKQKQTNFGLDVKLFNKVTINAEYFNRVTSSMLISVPLAFTTGFSSVTSNVGSLKNSGVNIGVTYDAISKKNSYLSFYANVGYVQQKITELFQGKNYWIIPNTGVSWAVGQPISYFYPIFSQVNPTTGLPEWFVPNSNPDLIIQKNADPKNVTSTFNSTGLQQNTDIKRYAPFNGGFGMSAGFHEFSIAADFTFSQGKYMINNDRYFFENPNQFSGYNQSVNVNDYWKAPGDVTRFPKYGIQFTQFDTRLIENASFMRLKNLTIAYNVSKDLLNKTKVISSVKFYVTFRNIWTLTKYTGPDPEIDTNVSLGANPNTRQTAVGMNITF